MNMRILIRLVMVALLGVATALLASCGSSGKGLIPTANGTALQGDFEEVARAAESGNGSCKATESALGKTEQDFLALPTTVDKGLHRRLEEGIAHLHKQALAVCEQPAATSTSTTSTQTSTTPPTSGTTSTETTSTTAPGATTSTPTSTQTPPTTSTPQNPGGGVEAPEQGSGEQGAGEPEAGAGAGASKEGADNGAAGSGGASAGGGQ
jgi:hypothetical protein